MAWWYPWGWPRLYTLDSQRLIWSSRETVSLDWYHSPPLFSWFRTIRRLIDSISTLITEYSQWISRGGINHWAGHWWNNICQIQQLQQAPCNFLRLESQICWTLRMTGNLSGKWTGTTAQHRLTRLLQTVSSKSTWARNKIANLSALLQRKGQCSPIWPLLLPMTNAVIPPLLHSMSQRLWEPNLVTIEAKNILCSRILLLYLLLARPVSHRRPPQVSYPLSPQHSAFCLHLVSAVYLERMRLLLTIWPLSWHCGLWYANCSRVVGLVATSLIFSLYLNNLCISTIICPMGYTGSFNTIIVSNLGEETNTGSHLAFLVCFCQ